MCTKTILDASLFSRFGDNEMKAWRQWIESGDGVLAYTTTGRFGRELRNNWMIRNYVFGQRRGRSALVKKPELDEAAAELQGREFSSNDQHVLELALASSAQVLCTGDEALKQDFLKNLPKLRRGVYPHNASRKAREKFLSAYRCSAG